MLPSPRFIAEIPVFIPMPVMTPAFNAPALYRVYIRVLMLPSIEHLWTGNATDDEHARTLAIDDARRRWSGYPLCLTSIQRVHA